MGKLDDFSLQRNQNESLGTVASTWYPEYSLSRFIEKDSSFWRTAILTWKGIDCSEKRCKKKGEKCFIKHQFKDACNFSEVLNKVGGVHIGSKLK